MSCDDQCLLKLADMPNDPSTATEILKNTAYSTFRQYFKNDGVVRKSAWMTLTKGEPYYIEAHHSQGTWHDHVSVAVEIEQTGTPIADHHHTKREVQYLSIDPKNDFDTTKITVTNPDDKEYVLIFKNPTTLKDTNINPIKASGSAWDVEKAIRDYYRETFGSNIAVNMTMYDSADIVTSVAADCVKREYFVRAKRLIKTASVASIMVAKTTTTSSVTAVHVMTSSTPLSGNYKIKCTNKAGLISYSNEIPYNNHALWTGYKVMEGCSASYDKMKFEEGLKYDYYENGRSLIVTFEGLNFDPAQLEIVDSTDKPLTAINITYEMKTLEPFSTNLWYEPIPFENV